MLSKINFGRGSKLPLILQTEAVECGLACLGMMACYFGHLTDIATMRQSFSVSLKGSTLADLIRVARKIDLNSRAVKVDIDGVNQLRTPCVLHWDLNHFVVLKEAAANRVTIHDPAIGLRTLTLTEFSHHFTGIALELWPSPSFVPKNEKRKFRLQDFMGHVSGLQNSFLHIFLLALALEAFGLVSPFYLQWVVDNSLISADRDLLATLAFGFGTLLVLQQLINAARSWALLYFGTTLNVQWRSNVFAHLIRLPIEYFEKRRVGEVVSRFGEIESIQRTLTTSFAEAVIDGIMSCTSLFIMFVYSSQLAWVSVAATVVYLTVRWIGYTPLRAATEEGIIHSAKVQGHFLETIRGMRSLKLFQRQDERVSSWLNLFIDQVNAISKVERLQIAYRLTYGILFGIERIIVVWLGARLVLDGNFSVGVLLAFIAYREQFSARIHALIDKSFEVKMLGLQMERLSDIVVSEPEESLALDHGDIPIDPEIELRNLCFRFSETDRLILDQVNLYIPYGFALAITGPSGCGKSTLVNLMLGILEPTEGEILISGRNIKQFGKNALRSIVGTVMQDDVLFAGSIANNISFFDSNVDMNWVEQCAKNAVIHKDIMAMPMGYNTLVGDMGTVFSGGQKQRILLARALYRRPRILILDEATSHLDVELERYVNASVQSLKITRLIIAHRPETIASADSVFDLKTGILTHNSSKKVPRNASSEKIGN